MSNPSVILLELNELSPPLMDRFIQAGELPNFARFRREAEIFTTDAGEEPPFLEPWIQWVTVHTGMPYRAHKLFNLNDGHKLDAPRIWDVLSENGRTSWVCGSMNPGYRAGFKGQLLPDPWTTEVRATSEELAGFLQFVQRMVQEYTSEKVPLSAVDYAKFALFMATHGLSPESLIGLGLQLAEERTNHAARWKRAAALDLLLFDVFRHFYKKLSPSLSTFFANSTAHYQHYYWRNLDPDGFQIKPTAEDQAEHHDAVLYGYRRMDSLIGRFIELAGDSATLVFVTALSQQPYLKFEDEGGKVSYRPRDFDGFLSAVGVTGYAEVAPVMTQNFHVRYKDQQAAKNAAGQLEKLTIGGEAVMAVHLHGDSIHAGCRLHGKIDRGAMIEGTATPVRFFDHLYQIEGVKSGMHHPDGMLWVRRPDRRHEVHPGRVPLTRVAPMILDMFSIAPPATMEAAPIAGFASLVA